MRRSPISLFLALPSALAFSLSNFQEITSTAIPISCLLTYDTQIGDCTKKDFNNGCSNECIQNLLVIQSDVQEACSTVFVNPSTLLGIVKSGGIVAALCPILGSTTTTTSTSATPQVIVTLPTTSPGVVLPTSKSTIIAQPTASITARPTPTIISLSIVSSVASTSSVATTSSAGSTSLVEFTSSVTSSALSTSTLSTSTTEVPQTTATMASSTTSSEAVPVTTATSNGANAAAGSPPNTKATPKPDSGTGGGSPFDISSSGCMAEYNSVVIVGLVLAWAGYFLGR